MFLLIDDGGSFAYNLAHGFEVLGVDVAVRRCDRTDPDGAAALDPRAIVVTFGEGGSGRTDGCGSWIERFAGRVPLFGIGMGHVGIAAALGARTRIGRPVHGKASTVIHDGAGLFAGLPSPLAATRYDSWVVEEPLPEGLEVAARTAEGEVVALRHRTWPIASVQFDPSSAFTEGGRELLANVIRWAIQWWETGGQSDGKGGR